MDRTELEGLLDEGRSLAEIGRRAGRHESTVAYWVRKHGFDAAHRTRHAARGGLARDKLEELVESGMSVAQIAAATERSKTTVRHWMLRYGLATSGASRRCDRRATDPSADCAFLVCSHHGPGEFFRHPSGRWCCKRCRSEAVSRRRRRVKAILVAEAGGACQICGYARTVGALHFHHVDPSLKRLEINARGAALAIDRLREEARKCMLLCANCHAEAEAGMLAPLPRPTLRRMKRLPRCPG